LHACETESCVIVACDLPFVTSELFAVLLDIMSGLELAADAIVPLQGDGRPQPLCAVYRRMRSLAAADAAIAGGQHTPRAMLDTISVRYVEFETLAPLPGSAHFFINLNRPEDYELARKIGSEF
jgi:molybdopterin-guanine dinucleotide biosynthesis protein A